MSSASQTSKAMRGTKRACQACEVRFYDLRRDPIVCPSCGALYTPVQPVVETARAAAFAGKTSWRSRGFKRPEPTPVDVDAERTVALEDTAAQELEVETEAAAEPVQDDDIVLEQEPDDADVSGLIDHGGEPKEQ